MNVYVGFKLAVTDFQGETTGRLEIWRTIPEDGTSTSYKQEFELSSVEDAEDARDWVKQLLVEIIEQM